MMDTVFERSAMIRPIVQFFVVMAPQFLFKVAQVIIGHDVRSHFVQKPFLVMAQRQSILYFDASPEDCCFFFTSAPFPVKTVIRFVREKNSTGKWVQNLTAVS